MLYLLQDLQLVWQASLDRPPVNLAVAKFGDMPGIVCSLDENGMLCAWYQGTDPPTSAVLATETKEMDYEQINREHRQLLQVGEIADEIRRTLRLRCFIFSLQGSWLEEMYSSPETCLLRKNEMQPDIRFRKPRNIKNKNIQHKN